MSNEADLLTAYLGLWNNRAVKAGASAEPGEILRELIRRELLDENAHPRTRKPKHEKFYVSVKRVMGADLPAIEKANLVSVYVRVMEDV
ncbi:hypothetical protein [Peribacillus glennii]|uniref:Uncharacterized protein n=1 Tax=Peribacillus glennii TaxID=2303991 RepID=A0A372LGI9_9BACI|nr:hypothetical protein [Peribacillus glennii]RFU65420.1 hypothetical protein D0466_05880 [Peribacillus glennii]